MRKLINTVSAIPDYSGSNNAKTKNTATGGYRVQRREYLDRFGNPVYDIYVWDKKGNSLSKTTNCNPGTYVNKFIEKLFYKKKRK